MGVFAIKFLYLHAKETNQLFSEAFACRQSSVNLKFNH